MPCLLFQNVHTKQYTEFEEKFRMKVYLENRHKIAQHNIRHARGEVSYSLAMNHFGDLVFDQPTKHVYENCLVTFIFFAFFSSTMSLSQS